MVVKRNSLRPFSDAVTSSTEPIREQEVISRWCIGWRSEPSAVSSSCTIHADGTDLYALFSGASCLLIAPCGDMRLSVRWSRMNRGPADIRNNEKDKCSKCLSGCKFRNVGNFGGFFHNKLRSKSMTENQRFLLYACDAPAESWLRGVSMPEGERYFPCANIGEPRWYLMAW